jgi:hypothetical protein
VRGSCFQGTGNECNERKGGKAGRRGIKQGKKEHNERKKKKIRRNKKER